MEILYERRGIKIIKCKICGDYVPHFRLDNEIDEFYPHIGEHMKAFVKFADGQTYAVLFYFGSSPVGFMRVVNKIPQLSLIQAVDIQSLIDKLLKACGGDVNYISNFNGMYDNFSSLPQYLIDDFKTIFMTTNYQCGLCGGKYDCGLPSVEIAAKHALTCARK